MLYAVISDVHGNCPALKAVLEDAAKAGAQQYLFAGDYVTDQPYTREIFETLSALPDAVLVAGNRDDYMGRLDPAGRGRVQSAILYLAEEELGEDGLRWMRALPHSQLVKTPDGRKTILIEHICKEINGKLRTHERVTPGALVEAFPARDAAHEDVARFAKGVLTGNPLLLEDLKARSGADVVISGHNHLQYAVEAGGMLLINPGSCGTPSDMQPGAPYTLLRYEDGQFSVEERRVAYNVRKTAAEYRASRYYQEAGPWCELVIRCMETGQNYFADLFRFVAQENQRLCPQTDEEYNKAFYAAYRRTQQLPGF